MRRSRLVFLASLLTGCVAAVPGCSTDPEVEPALAGRLESDTGVKWAVHLGDGGEVRFLAPEKPVRVAEGTPEQMARAFFDRYRSSLHGTGDASELRASSVISDEDGSAHLRFEHYLPETNIRVFDVATTAHFTSDGALYYAQPGFRADLSRLPKTARVTEEAASRAAAESAATACVAPPEAVRQISIELGVTGDERSPSVLAWRVLLATDGSERCSAPEIVVDATTGTVIGMKESARSLWDKAGGARFHHMGDTSDIKTIDVTQSWDVLGTKYQMKTAGASPRIVSPRYRFLLNADIETRELGKWDMTSPALGAAVDAHFNAMHALRYFKDVHGRNGTTGLGSDVVVVVHDPFDEGRNAFHDAKMYVWNEMHCGDGDFLRGGNALPFCTAFDVVAHEMAHGVTHYTSGLVYEGESGALNEAFSDVMAASAENWFEVRDPKRNFLIGERLYKNGQGMRDMANPGRFGHPDHYDRRRKCGAGESPEHKKNDDCFVHFNSNIANRAFSLMTEGGVHTTSNVGVPKGIGWERSRALWFQTFTSLRPQATFLEAALSQVSQAALAGPEVVQAVACAWNAVGVLVLGAAIHPALGKVMCHAPSKGEPPKPTGSTCAGRESGYVCSDVAPYTAYVCEAGGIAGAVYCSDPERTCKKAGPADWTAAIGPDGELVCE